MQLKNTFATLSLTAGLCALPLLTLAQVPRAVPPVPSQFSGLSDQDVALACIQITGIVGNYLLRPAASADPQNRLDAEELLRASVAWQEDALALKVDRASADRWSQTFRQTPPSQPMVLYCWDQGLLKFASFSPGARARAEESLQAQFKQLGLDAPSRSR